MKKIILTIFLLIFFLPLFAQAQSADNVFKARVVNIIEQKENILLDGSKSFQQNLKLVGLEGDIKGQEIYYYGIGDIDLLNKNIYKAGDKVFVLESQDDTGSIKYYIVDYDRTNSLLLFGIIFLLSLFLVGRWKGVKSFISLILSFVIILKFILPLISEGYNAFLVTLVGSFLILVIVIYLTEGFNPVSHISMVSIVFSLLVSISLAWVFVSLSRLTGISGEEEGTLFAVLGQSINFRGILLAGIIIGAVGVLDDVVISQVTAVEQLNSVNTNLNKKELFKKAYAIGVSHINSMTNTLFLAYAGASMTLLLLISSGNSAFSSWSQIVNNSTFATEIVRTLSGSVGLILSVPISTVIAVWWYKRK